MSNKQQQQQRRNEVKAELRAHFDRYGQQDVASLRVQYPDVAERTLCRWASEVRLELKLAGAETVSQQIISSRRSPRMIDYRPSAGDEPVKMNWPWMNKLGELYEQSEVLQRYACGEKRPSDPSIRNPMLFEKSIKLRKEIISMGISQLSQLHNAERNQKFFDIIVEEIGHIAPEMQRAIMLKMQELDQQWNPETGNEELSPYDT